MKTPLLLIPLLLTWLEADLTSASCVCTTGSSVNVRNSACNVIGQASRGQCFRSQGNSRICRVSGRSYNYVDVNFNGQAGWMAELYLQTRSDSQCSGSEPQDGRISSGCLACICEVEGCEGQVGRCRHDVTSIACGPYQIHEEYYIDCHRPGSDWQGCTKTKSCSETCVRSYMSRYGRYCTGGRAPTCQDYARIHNGGPHGCRYSSTLGYWGRVERCCRRTGRC